MSENLNLNHLLGPMAPVELSLNLAEGFLEPIDPKVGLYGTPYRKEVVPFSPLATRQLASLSGTTAKELSRYNDPQERVKHWILGLIEKGNLGREVSVEIWGGCVQSIWPSEKPFLTLSSVALTLRDFFDRPQGFGVEYAAKGLRIWAKPSRLASFTNGQTERLLEIVWSDKTVVWPLVAIESGRFLRGLSHPVPPNKKSPTDGFIRALDAALSATRAMDRDYAALSQLSGEIIPDGRRFLQGHLDANLTGLNAKEIERLLYATPHAEIEPLDLLDTILGLSGVLAKPFSNSHPAIEQFAMSLVRSLPGRHMCQVCLSSWSSSCPSNHSESRIEAESTPVLEVSEPLSFLAEDDEFSQTDQLFDRFRNSD